MAENSRGTPASASDPVTVVVLGRTRDDVPDQLINHARTDDRYRWQSTDADGFADAVAGAEAVLLWDFFSSALSDVWAHCDALRWVHVAAAGVDTLLFNELRSSSVIVSNARGTFDQPIAEYVAAQILAHAKQIRRNTDLQRAHRWQHRETQRVAGTRALVVGTGPVGAAIARTLSGLGIEVRGAGRSARTGDPHFGTVVASADLGAEVGWADWVINAAPLTPATRNLFDAGVFAAMKETGYFINIGRGASVDQTALVEVLHSGGIAGAALDVCEPEPLPPDSELWDVPGLSLSAHMSGDVVGWRDTLAEQFIANLERWLDGLPLHNVVDKQLGYIRTEAPANPLHSD